MILVHQDMRLTQLYCLIVIGIFCGVKGKTISVDWTLAGVLNYNERYDFGKGRRLRGPIKNRHSFSVARVY